jgi:hypothetical protein
MGSLVVTKANRMRSLGFAAVIFDADSDLRPNALENGRFGAVLGVFLIVHSASHVRQYRVKLNDLPCPTIRKIFGGSESAKTGLILSQDGVFFRRYRSLVSSWRYSASASGWTRSVLLRTSVVVLEFGGLSDGEEAESDATTRVCGGDF